MANNVAGPPKIYTEVSTPIASGGSFSFSNIPLMGARGVYFTVTCDVNHQIASHTFTFTTIDGKTTNVTPGTLPSGAVETSNLDVNCAGILTSADLTPGANVHKCTMVRPNAGAAANPPASASPMIMGVTNVHLNIVKAATAGNATYTMYAAVYY